MKRIREKPWYNHAVALSIAVVLYVLLTNWGSVREGIGDFFRYFSPVIYGCIIAYIVSPLAHLYGQTLFGRIKKERTRVGLSNFLAFITVILFLVPESLSRVPQRVLPRMPTAAIQCTSLPAKPWSSPSSVMPPR